MAIKSGKKFSDLEEEMKELLGDFNKNVKLDFKKKEETKLDKLLDKLQNKKTRKAGILMHITSLANDYDLVGTMGKSAYEFVDFLKKSSQTLWQIYPLGPTGYNDSPYQCFSAFAGNPYLIDLMDLVEIGLLEHDDIQELKPENPLLVDYGKLYNVKLRVLEKAYEKHHLLSEEFENFKKDTKSWLDDYALFMSLKKHFDGQSWFNWPEGIKNRSKMAVFSYTTKLAREIEVQKFMQFLFFRQWLKLKQYANDNDIEIIGDIPIFVSSDSADAWANSELFVFESVAGVPPDYFSATGQLWGNPLYNWELMKENRYKWWKDRFMANLNLYDIIRLDHFRGFESYWSVDSKETTAINGKWLKGPAHDFFDEMFNSIQDLNLIAEDLGSLTDEVVKLKDDYNLPGMNILHFAFDNDPLNKYLPHNYTQNSVVYTGTHDNNTTVGWYEELSDENKGQIRDYLDVSDDNIAWHLIRLAQRSIANMCIIPMQDYICYGADSRINTPGVASGNWQWRIGEGVLGHELASSIAHITKMYGR